MVVSIISIGQELLLGDTINTNASWMGRLLSEHGMILRKVLMIGDDAQMINRALDQTLKSSDLVLMTGGLGPTHDDITKTTLAEYFGVEFVRHQPSFDHIKEIFERRGMNFSVSNHSQSDVLSNAEVLFNKTGTAPGMWIERKGRILVVLPGVPREMKYLMNHEVMPRLLVKNGHSAGYFSKYLQIVGIGESNLSDLVIGDTSPFTGENVSLAYLPHTHGITLRISSYAKDAKTAEKQAQPLIDHISTTAREYIFADEADIMLETAVVRLLATQGKKVATAESCSGGQLSHLITNVSGSSDVFDCGIISYANDIKMNLLGVSETDLIEHGAVSKPVALQMAKTVAKMSGADFGLSTTGIAGPTGGTAEKPVGTVWIGFWSETEHFAVKTQLYTDRLINKERSAIIALDLLRRSLSGITTLPYDLQKQLK